VAAKTNIESLAESLCLLTGEHFSSLGDKQVITSNFAKAGVNKVHVHPPGDVAEISQSDSCYASCMRNTQVSADADDEDARVREILSDSKMREILMDSNIQQLMTCLQNQPDKAQL